MAKDKNKKAQEAQQIPEQQETPAAETAEEAQAVLSPEEQEALKAQAEELRSQLAAKEDSYLRLAA